VILNLQVISKDCGKQMILRWRADPGRRAKISPLQSAS